jgi:hypothetical protein
MTKNEERFWERMKSYPYDYDFSKVKYVNAQTKVEIVCPKHGSFFVKPGHLTYYHSCCPKCKNDKFRNNKENFIERVNSIFNNKYDLSKFEYVNNKTNGIVICPEHGNFITNPHSLYQGKGCPKCGIEQRALKRRKSNEEFIKEAKEIHGDKYDYSKVKYKNEDTKICIICPEHGEFFQTPYNHLQGKGCPICNTSKMENEVMNFLKNQNFNYEYQKRFDWLGLQSLDFYLPDYNIGIECQGMQHFESVEHFGGKKNLKNNIERDIRKHKLCENNDIKMLYIINEEDIKFINDNKFDGIYNNDFILRNNLNEIIDKIKG